MWNGKVLFAGFALAAFAQAGPQDTIRSLDYPELARSFLDDHGLDSWIASGSAGRDFDQFALSPVFVSIELGTLELRIPAKSLEDVEIAEDFRVTVTAALDVQASWLEWSDPKRAPEFAEDWKALGKWVKSWSRGRLAHAQGGASLFDSLQASESVRAAATRLRAAMRADEATCAALGEVGRIVFAPTRRDFLQLMAVIGWCNEAVRESFWNDRVIDHTIEWVGWTQIVCMKFTQLPVDIKQPFAGVNMNADDKTGLAQYMAERAAALLLRREFWRQDAHFYEQALAGNLVIAATGRNNLRSGEWKLEMHTSGSSTQPYSRFVPGGNPNGGTLPKNPAGPGSSSGSATEVSLYRTTFGADYFLGPLREGQIAGAKLVAKDKKHRLADDKLAHFAVHSFKTFADHAVTAPFLGLLAEKQALPPLDFLDDYEDFFRAYRAGFLYWLQRHALPTEAESRAKFAQLILTHAENPARDPLDVNVETVYGLPISAMDGSTDTLEWRYLTWLAKKK